jgi:hypothetical protein
VFELVVLMWGYRAMRFELRMVELVLVEMVVMVVVVVVDAVEFLKMKN